MKISTYMIRRFNLTLSGLLLGVLFIAVGVAAVGYAFRAFGQPGALSNSTQLFSLLILGGASLVAGFAVPFQMADRMPQTAQNIAVVYVISVFVVITSLLIMLVVSGALSGDYFPGVAE